MYSTLYFHLHNQVKLSLYEKTSHNISYHFHQLALSFLYRTRPSDGLINEIRNQYSI